MTAPCRECPFREVGCHGRCEQYRDWLRRLRHAKKAADRQKEEWWYEAKNAYFRQQLKQRYKF